MAGEALLYQYLTFVTISFTIWNKLILLEFIWQIAYAFILIKFLHTLVLVTTLILFIQYSSDPVIMLFWVREYSKHLEPI